jgi:hypothetical protein
VQIEKRERQIYKEKIKLNIKEGKKEKEKSDKQTDIQTELYNFRTPSSARQRPTTDRLARMC